MKLRIATPLQIVVDGDDIMSLRAEDSSGSFGIMSGHADFLTRLAVSVVTWRRVDGRACFCAVRHGVLTVTSGRDVAIATREAVLGDDLATLDSRVVARFRADVETQRVEHVASARLQLSAIRQIMSRLGSSGTGRSA